MNILYRPHFWLCVILLTLVYQLFSNDAYSAIDFPKDVSPDEDASVYAPTRTQLYHQISGMRTMWIFMMMQEAEHNANRDGTPFDRATFWDNTQACIASVPADILTDEILPESPFSDAWLLLTIVTELTNTCADTIDATRLENSL